MDKQAKKHNGVNDIDLNRWKEYEDIYFDSLWIIHERDKSGAHSNVYHGNFVPQIPNQLIRRFTRPGDIVLDPFLGSGTTLIEAQRLGRVGIGIELQEAVADLAKSAVDKELPLHQNQTQRILIGDSRETAMRQQVEKASAELSAAGVTLLLLHPPYDDIIKFSDDPRDLSNQKSTDLFVEAFGDVIKNLYPLLEANGHLAIVIGDKYQNSNWVPLGFQLMAETMKIAPGLVLKSTIIKNMTGNRGKSNQEQLWKYRSLSGGFYIFKHEYIFLFKKSR